MHIYTDTDRYIDIDIDVEIDIYIYIYIYIYLTKPGLTKPLATELIRTKSVSLSVLLNLWLQKRQ